MYPSPYIRFKTARQEREWFAGGLPGLSLHPALYVLVLAAAHWHYRRVGRPAVLTGLVRSREEELRLYPDRPDQRSPHEFGRAADFRTRDLEPSVAGEWADWLNRTFPYHGRAGANAALLHEVGNLGAHLHLQVGPAEAAPGAPETFISTT